MRPFMASTRLTSESLAIIVDPLAVVVGYGELANYTIVPPIVVGREHRVHVVVMLHY
jgi:hypothetical protein